MLHLAISFAKKDLFIDKKMQWKMSQNSEQLAGNGDKDVFCDFDGVLASSVLMMPGGAALARAYGTQVEPPAPGGSHPHWPQMQKSLLVEQAFRILSVIEDDSPLRGSPCGPLLTQRSLAPLESNLLPPEVLILTGYRCKKACSLSRLFEFGR